MKFTPTFCVLCALVISLAKLSAAHPMGNFSINHYARFEARANALSLRYILDFAEIPTAQRMPQLDSNGDGKIEGDEKSAFLRAESAALAKNLSVEIDGKRVPLQVLSSRLDLHPGAGGLDTLRVVIEYNVAVSSGEHRVSYRDDNFRGRTGWMEVIAVAGKGGAIRDSSAATVDRSRGLTVFPADAEAVKPLQNSATFTMTGATGASGATSGNASATASGAAQPNPNPASPETQTPAATSGSATPQNRFTQAIAERDLTPGVMLAGILISFLFGVAHSLSPGHGKTMVAAYLVGSRGTPRHAMLLGLVVTITHTFGVFLLGLATLFATNYIVPERLYPALSAASGLIIFGVGLWLLMSRWQMLAAQQHNYSHSHDGHGHDGHEHSHDGDHAHAHSHDHDHSHAHGEVHSHGGKAHSHAVPEGPVTLRTLVTLGISGGIVPCPEALVVLLAAVKMHRIGYGLLLIVAFSIGLAAALIAIGLVVVSAGQRLSRLDRFSAGGKLTRYLPIGSAAIITIIGIALTLRAAGGAP